MAHLVRPLIEWPRWYLKRCSPAATFRHLFNSPSLLFADCGRRRLHFTGISTFHWNLHSRSRGLISADAPSRSDFVESDDDGDSLDSNALLKKSRNEKKREARRAVRWGMELAAFSPPQIKRILRVASLESEVFDALMLVKRLGRDVREGKRRQFSYIGRLLREVQPELIEGLIEATKVGDQSKFQALSGSDTRAFGDDEEAEETEYEDEEQESNSCIDIASRWFDGLINKDIDITNEIYSISVDFDRQELRRLVRKVSSMQEKQGSSEENEGEVDAALLDAQRSLTRFLRAVANQLPTE